MPEESDLEKTEDATPKRIDDAIKKGQVAFSREVTNFLIIVVLALNIVWLAPIYAKEMTFSLSRFIMMPHDIPMSFEAVHTLTMETIRAIGLAMLPPIALVMLIAAASSLFQNGVIFSGEPLIPKLEKISVLKGFKRLFSMRSLIEFVNGIIKISLVGLVSYLAVESQLERLEGLVMFSIMDIIAVLATLSLKIVVASAAVMLVIAFLDYLYQKYEYLKSLRMTKQEVKDEYKQTEGDPQIKARLRQIRQERARKRMMSAVPEADVVIRNPEHYAVALKYDQATMRAPVVLAMGQDFIALQIIERAEEHDIPTVRNRPLARALFDSCEIDEEIPLEHYQAVAEVISYVYKLKRKAA